MISNLLNLHSLVRACQGDAESERKKWMQRKEELTAPPGEPGSLPLRAHTLLSRECPFNA